MHMQLQMMQTALPCFLLLCWQRKLLNTPTWMCTHATADDADCASLLRCAALAAQATKYPHLDVSKVVEAVDRMADEVGVDWM